MLSSPFTTGDWRFFSPQSPQVICIHTLIAASGWKRSTDVADDTTFQPTEFTAENPLRKLIAAPIHIVSETVKQPIDA